MDGRGERRLFRGSRKQRDRKPGTRVQRGPCQLEQQTHSVRQFNRHHEQSGNAEHSANLETGGLRFDHNVNSRLFVFGAADFMSNALQFLDLRSVYSGGFGFHAIANDRTTLNFLGGLNYTHETYSNGTEVPPTPPSTTPTGIFASYGVTNRFVALTLGEELDKKLGKSTVLTQNVGFFPDLQQTGEYRMTFNAGTVTKLNKWFGWQNQFGDIYVSNPPSGAKKNDVIFTTGLNLTFTH